MKNLSLLLLACVTTTSAFAESDISKTISSYEIDDLAKSNIRLGGRAWSGGDIMLGNYYYLGDSYICDSLVELDISADGMDVLDSFGIQSQTAVSMYMNEPPDNLDAFYVTIYDGSSATGNAKSDYSTIATEANKLFTSELFSIADIEAGIKFENLNIDVADDSYLFISISPDQSVIPVVTGGLESGGFGVINAEYYTVFSYEGSTVVPEPSTYAAIFGALALSFAAYRRRK